MLTTLKEFNLEMVHRFVFATSSQIGDSMVQVTYRMYILEKKNFDYSVGNCWRGFCDHYVHSLLFWVLLLWAFYRTALPDNAWNDAFPLGMERCHLLPRGCHLSSKPQCPLSIPPPLTAMLLIFGEPVNVNSHVKTCRPDITVLVQTFIGLS